MYRSSTTSINRSSVVEAGMAFNIKKIFNLDIKGSTETTLANKNTEQMLSYHTIGGNPSKGLEGQVNIGSTQPTINISEWLSSTNSTNMALIDAQQGSLIPIYALVDDFIKARLRTAVNVYLQQKAFKCTYYTVPVYRFHTKESRYRHFLTIDTEEVPKVDPKGWRAEGVRFKIYPPTIQPEGTVPLYRFKSTDAAMRLFFSTNKNEIPEGQYRFYFDKIIGYVHTAENHPLGSVPLYKYSTSVNDSGHRYFYTTDQNEMGPNGKDGFLSNGIACYVFMP